MRSTTALRTSIIATVIAAVISGILVLGFELLALSPDYRATQQMPPWAAAGAMATFALVCGAGSTSIAALLGDWFRPGLGVFSLGVFAVGVWLSQLALATRPVEAPMFLALHVVFVIAFGVVIPIAWLASSPQIPRRVA